MLGNLDVWCLCFLISFIGRGEITKNRQHKITQPLTRTFSHHWNTPHIGTRVDGKYMSKQAVANFDSCYRLKELYILIAIIFLYMIMFELFDCKLQIEKLITLRLMLLMMKWAFGKSGHSKFECSSYLQYNTIFTTYRFFKNRCKSQSYQLSAYSWGPQLAKLHSTADVNPVQFCYRCFRTT